jgi:hypothetical protein
VPRNPQTAPKRLAVHLRRIQAVKMRLDGVRVDEIAETLGYRSTGAVFQDFSRYLAKMAAEPTAELRALEVQRLDDMYAAVMGVLRREHITVSHGHVVMVPDPDNEGAQKVLLDDGPVLAAVDRLLKIQERRAKLLGLDAPTKVSVITDAALDEELARATAEAAELERLTAGEDPDPEEPEGEER